MVALDRHFADYAAHHKTALNKLTHTFGIPLIAFGLLGLLRPVVLWRADGFTLDLALVLVAAIVVQYLFWHVGLALVFAAIVAGLYLAAGWLTWPVALAALVVGWILQYLGHLVFEGKQPAFHDNLIHTLVGPLWMVALLLSKLRLYRNVTR